MLLVHWECCDDHWWFCYVVSLRVLGVYLWMLRAMMDFGQLPTETGDFPSTFCKEFLAIRHQAREISRLQWFSFSTLLRISDSTKLCPSIIRFDQGDSASVVYTFILSISHSVVNSSLTNSPPLSVKNLSTVPYTATQYFDGKITVADKLVAWSIVWGP